MDLNVTFLDHPVILQLPKNQRYIKETISPAETLICSECSLTNRVSRYFNLCNVKNASD